MTLPEISIRRPVLAWMLMTALIIFGGISFFRMGISQLPNIDFPVVNISLSYPGAAPEVMETTVVDPIEEAVMSVQGVRNVTSASHPGFARITLEFELNRDIDAALQEVQAKVSQRERLLPKNIEAPVITKTNPEDQPIVWLVFTSERYSLREVMVRVKNQIKDQFATVPGVGDVILAGFVEPNLRVWVSAEKLNRYALTIQDIITAIQRENVEPPGGYLTLGSIESNVRTVGEIRSPRELGAISIHSRGNTPVFSVIHLKDVAKIEEGLADIRQISRESGKTAVGIGIQKQRGSNAVAVADGIKEKVAEIQKTLPEGYRLDVTFDTTQFIRDSVGELNFTLLLSALLTGVVCWIFLGSWSSTLNVLLAIPTSIVGTFIALHFAGFTLNTFTLLGLSLAIGIVVDDAIMVLENIIRHREAGESRFNAALQGAREITLAATAATTAIVAIFLPVAFMKGIIGKFFFEFGITLTVAVLLSLVEALTLTPMRASQFIDIGKRTTWLGKGIEFLFDRLRGSYKRALAFSLERPGKVIGISLVFFAMSLGPIYLLRKEFVPAQDQSFVLMRLETPIGTSLEFTSSKFLEAEAFLKSRPEVLNYLSAVGGLGGGEVNSGIIFVNLKPRNERSVSQQEFMQACREHLNRIPYLKAFIQDLSMSSFTASRGFPIEFAVVGPDIKVLSESVEKIMNKLGQTGQLTDLDSDFKLGKLEYQIIPDREQTALHGVSASDIGQTISALIGGSIAGQYTQEGHRNDIRVQLDSKEKNRPDVFERLTVRNNRGQLVPLAQLVKIQEEKTAPVISRRNRQRAITVFANVSAGSSQAEALNTVRMTSQKLLPEGYRVALSGSAQIFQESFQSLLFALILGLIISYMVLASQFNSFIDPFTILLALPFSASGAFLGLLIANQSINIFSMIGLILLMGIVKKNSILLVDFAHQVRARGSISVNAALLEACPIRLRPILMTSIAIIAGAIPAALALGPGAETRIPMAVTVIGGVVVSTFLTLLVVPCVYSVFSRLEKFRKAGKGAGESDQAA